MDIRVTKRVTTKIGVVWKANTVYRNVDEGNPMIQDMLDSGFAEVVPDPIYKLVQDIKDAGVNGVAVGTRASDQFLAACDALNLRTGAGLTKPKKQDDGGPGNGA